MHFFAKSQYAYKIKLMKIYSPSFFSKVIKFEMLFFIILIIGRIKLIVETINLGELRDLISIIDFESGYSFVLIAFLLLINYLILNYENRTIYWPFKVGGLLSLSIISSINFFDIILVTLIIYYLTNPIRQLFKLSNKDLFFYLVLVLCIVLAIVFLDADFPLLEY